MTDSGIAADPNPGDAFATLASDTRVAILHALWDADDPLSFSALQSAAGVEDSGQFNYHLGQFDGRFVEQTPDGYQLTEAGGRLVGALVGGTYTSDGATGPVEMDAACPACGEALTFAYGDGVATIDCETCGCLSEAAVPPSVLADRERAALPHAVQQYGHATIERAARGICRRCQGPMDGRLVTAATTADDVDTDPGRPLDEIPMTRSECRRCGHTVDTALPIRLVRHPAVVSFLHDHGVDYRDLSLWELGGVSEDAARVTGRDPLRATTTYREGGERLTLDVDATLTVVDTDRESA